MMKVLALLIIASLVLSGCGTTKFGIENVKIFKTEKERVDQAVGGNRGYVVGECPDPIPERKSTRTLMVVDIDVPEDMYPLSTIVSIGKDLPESKEEAAVSTTSGRATEEETWIK
ncbi:MAG: hypothetical protein PVH45_01255 [Candidatus Omnitrophota bacterium]|jgi:hypothetical protein